MMKPNFATNFQKSDVLPKLYDEMGVVVPAVFQGKIPSGAIELFSKRLGTVQIDPAMIDDFLKFHSASFGITRSGKSNGTGRLIEEHLLKRLQVLIVDYKGEYVTIRNVKGVKLNVLAIEGRNGSEDARNFLKGTDSVILNLETIKDEVYIPYLFDFFSEMWEIRRQMKQDADSEARGLPPIKVFIDEAQHYIPRQAAKAMPKELIGVVRNLKGMIRNIAQQGLGLGLSLHLVTQRPTYIDPFIRNQCEVFILYRQKWENDVQVYLDIMPAQNGSRDWHMRRETAIVNMPTGQAWFVRPGGKTNIVNMRVKRSVDLSKTPGWEQHILQMEAVKHGTWGKIADMPSDSEVS